MFAYVLVISLENIQKKENCPCRKLSVKKFREMENMFDKKFTKLVELF